MGFIVGHGPLLTLMVAASVAIRDVYCSNIFQSIGIFEAIAWALSPIVVCTIIFAAVTKKLCMLIIYWKLILAVNGTTAASLVFLFYALRLSEPVLVTVVFGAVAWLAMQLLNKRDSGLVHWIERHLMWCLLGVTMAAFTSIIASPSSGIESTSDGLASFGLFLAAVGAVISSFGVRYEQQLGSHGISPTTILALRFILLLVLSFGLKSYSAESTLRFDLHTLLYVYPLLFLSIALPSWVAQFAVAMTHPVTFKAIFALVPSFVFFLQLVISDRFEFSSVNFSIVMIYTIIVLVGNSVNAWTRSQDRITKTETG